MPVKHLQAVNMGHGFQSVHFNKGWEKNATIKGRLYRWLKLKTGMTGLPQQSRAAYLSEKITQPRRKTLPSVTELGMTGRDIWRDISGMQRLITGVSQHCSWMQSRCNFSTGNVNFNLGVTWCFEEDSSVVDSSYICWTANVKHGTLSFCLWYLTVEKV